MKTLHYSTKAKKDLKKYRHDPQKMKNLYTVLELLVNDMKLPAIYQPHFLPENIPIAWNVILKVIFC